VKSRTDVDLDLIVAELCVPGTSWKYRQGTNEHLLFMASSLNRYARAWNLFICGRLLPSSHNHEVTVERAIVLWGIITDEYIDVGYLMYQNMLRFMRGVTTGAMPHASIITQLCILAGVRWSGTEQLQYPQATLDSAAIQRLDDWHGGRPHPRGLGYIVNGDEDAPPSPPRQRRGRGQLAARGGRQARVGASQAASGSGTAGVGNTEGLSEQQYRRLIRRVDASHEASRLSFESLTRTLGEIYQQQGITPAWPVFGASTVYPPPDTPPSDEE